MKISGKSLPRQRGRSTQKPRARYFVRRYEIRNVGTKTTFLWVSYRAIEPIVCMRRMHTLVLHIYSWRTSAKNLGAQGGSQRPRSKYSQVTDARRCVSSRTPRCVGSHVGFVPNYLLLPATDTRGYMTTLQFVIFPLLR